MTGRALNDSENMKDQTRAKTLDQVSFVPRCHCRGSRACSRDSVRGPSTSTGSGGCRSGCSPCSGGLDQVGRAQPITSWCRHAGSPDLGSNTVGSGHRPRCSPDRGSRRGMACSRRVRIYAPRYVPVVKKSCKRTLRLIVVSRVRSSNIFCAPTSRRCRLQRLDVTDGRLHRSACTTESGPMARGNYCGIKIPAHNFAPVADVVNPVTWAGSVPYAAGIAPRMRIGHSKSGSTCPGCS